MTRDSLPRMADISLVPAAISLLTDSRDKIRAVASSIEALAGRTDIPDDVVRSLAAQAAALRAIGGPTDPTVGGGS